MFPIFNQDKMQFIYSEDMVTLLRTILHSMWSLESFGAILRSRISCQEYQRFVFVGAAVTQSGYSDKSAVLL